MPSRLAGSCSALHGGASWVGPLGRDHRAASGKSALPSTPHKATSSRRLVGRAVGQPAPKFRSRHTGTKTQARPLLVQKAQDRQARSSCAWRRSGSFGASCCAIGPGQQGTAPLLIAGLHLHIADLCRSSWKAAGEGLLCSLGMCADCRASSRARCPCGGSRI